MPVFNSGIVPASGAVATELQAVTRRAFIPKLVVQLYNATPMLSLLLRTAQRARGGLSQITIPVQGNSLVTSSWAGYDGTFPQPAIVTGIQNAEFNLKLLLTPVPFLATEALIQSTEAVIPLAKARLADIKTQMTQTISTALFTENTGTPLVTDSLTMAYDDSTNTNVYGGINRTTNTFWKSTLKTSAGGISTRTSMIPFLVQTTSLAGGEAPDFAVMNPGDWATLMTDYMSSESFRTMPGTKYGKDDMINAGFRGVLLGDTPFFMDPFCPQGTCIIMNSKYLALYLSEDAPFAFSGFHSAIPNLQLAEIGVVIVLFDVVCAKPISGMRITGITGNKF